MTSISTALYSVTHNFSTTSNPVMNKNAKTEQVLTSFGIEVLSLHSRDCSLWKLIGDQCNQLAEIRPHFIRGAVFYFVN